MNKRRNELIEKHYRENYTILVKRMSFRVGGDRVLSEDVVQEAYARATKYFPRFDPKHGSFDMWFSRILNNALNAVKNEEKQRGATHEIDAQEEWQEVPEELTILPREKEHRFRVGLIKAIGREHKRDKTILAMFFLDGFKSREVAEYLNLNHNTVRQVINRFREKLVALPMGVI